MAWDSKNSGTGATVVLGMERGAAQPLRSNLKIVRKVRNCLYTTDPDPGKVYPVVLHLRHFGGSVT